MGNALVKKTRNELAAAKKNPRNALLDATRGALMGVTTDVLGYPVDLMTMALRPFGYNVEQPVGGSDWLASRLTSPTGSVAETAGRVAAGFATPGPEDMLRMMGVLNPKAPVNELITYHGSPHRINNVDAENPVGKFDLSKVGTGEGAQAYGYGIYLAETPGVARSYMTSDLNGATWMLGGKGVRSGKLNDALTKWASPDEGSVQPAIDRIKGFLKDHSVWADYPEHSHRLDDAKAQLALLEKNKSKLTPNNGHFYTVDLPDEHIAKMLDWDAPLSEQPEILEKLRKAGLVDGDTVQGLEMARGSINEISGQQVVDDLATQWGNDYGMDSLLSVEAKNGREAASKYLRSLGIPGIKYFDGGSRAAGEGTRNFVIFDPEYAKILKRE